jgi:hypothetical protein
MKKPNKSKTVRPLHASLHEVTGGTTMSIMLAGAMAGGAAGAAGAASGDVIPLKPFDGDVIPLKPYPGPR